MTAQTYDDLRYSGLQLGLAGDPLAPWLQSRRHRKLYHFKWRTSANWRGYHGYWELRDGKLYLAKLLGRLRVFSENEWGDSQQDPLDALFPGHEGPVFANWFSGVIRCPYGKMLRYVHLGHLSVFEFDLFFQIKQGRQYRMWMKKNEPPPDDIDDDFSDMDDEEWLKKWAALPKTTDQTASGFMGLVGFEKKLL